VQALIVAVTAVLLRRSFTKLYSKAQIALLETLAQPPDPRRDVVETTLPAMMREAQLATIHIGESATVTGKMIGELRLRTNTGASIVGIQRGQENIINPGPDEELRAGDEVLLLGSQQHLDSARKLLSHGCVL
jgi:uncharacterized protein with PhoU and TrkA domain